MFKNKFIIIAIMCVLMFACSTKKISTVSEEPTNTNSTIIEQQTTQEENLETVYFNYDDASLNMEAIGVLNKNALILIKTGQMVVVEGRCDERGTNEYNIALGERRANSIKDYLVMCEVNTEKIFTVSMGEENPIDPGHDEAAWAKNRCGLFIKK